MEICRNKRNQTILCVVFKVYIGDWSNGMIGVSKTFGGSSILSSPALVSAEKLGK